MTRDIRGLLLCGGIGSRFGGDKLLSGATPIAAEAARHLHEALGSVLAVIPPGKRRLRESLEAVGCDVLETDRTTLGMSGSLTAGIEASEAADGWVVALGDMPRIRVDTIRAVAQALGDGTTIALPVDAHGRRGHPVGFSSCLRDELLALRGDVGARSLLVRHAGEIRALVTDDSGIFVDIDTPGDLEAMQPSPGGE